MKPTEAINAGRSVLDPILVPAGFHFVPCAEGQSSGGDFAEACYVNGDRRLAFSYRFAIGLVTYHVGDYSIGHKEYMQFLGKAKDSAYAWFSRESPLAGFEALRHDLVSVNSDYCCDLSSTKKPDVFVTPGFGSQRQCAAKRHKRSGSGQE